MYTVKIYIARMGEEINTPKGVSTCQAGHMFYVISDGTTAGTRNYGFQHV